jgi:uncharacterized protein (DUF1697 family)
MPAYAAFLRGVSPMNAKMPELAKAFEAAGFTAVRTLLSSGNVLFEARAADEAALERRAELAVKKKLGREFMTFVRSVAALRELTEADPYRAFKLAPDAKRVVTFLREPPATKLRLPVEMDGARILAVRGGEAFSAYVRSEKGPVFMKLIAQTFGDAVTTRTLDTVKKACR